MGSVVVDVEKELTNPLYRDGNDSERAEGSRSKEK